MINFVTIETELKNTPEYETRCEYMDITDED